MHRKIKLIAPLLLAMSLPAGAQDGTGSANFVDAQGQSIGEALLVETEAGVLIQMEVSGLPEEQWVAFHVHEHGQCDASEDHETAGEHFDPDDREHGYLASGGPHAGDMPNQYVPAGGVLRAHVFNAFVSLDGEEDGIRGRALMLHEDADDYESQPSGESGDRIACGVVE